MENLAYFVCILYEGCQHIEVRFAPLTTEADPAQTGASAQRESGPGVKKDSCAAACVDKRLEDAGRDVQAAFQAAMSMMPSGSVSLVQLPVGFPSSDMMGAADTVTWPKKASGGGKIAR